MTENRYPGELWEGTEQLDVGTSWVVQLVFQQSKQINEVTKYV
jgi:hypothetical protein